MAASRVFGKTLGSEGDRAEPRLSLTPVRGEAATESRWAVSLSYHCRHRQLRARPSWGGCSLLPICLLPVTCFRDPRRVLPPACCWSHRASASWDVLYASPSRTSGGGRVNLATEPGAACPSAARPRVCFGIIELSKHGLCHPAETCGCQEVTGTHVPLSNGGERALGHPSEPG